MSFDLASRLASRRAEDLYRQRPLLESAQGPDVVVDGQPLLAFCSNDYLGLANHPEVIAALRAGAERWGVGGGASHLVVGHSGPHHELEAGPRRIHRAAPCAAVLHRLHGQSRRGDRAGRQGRHGAGGPPQPRFAAGCRIALRRAFLALPAQRPGKPRRAPGQGRGQYPGGHRRGLQHGRQSRRPAGPGRRRAGPRRLADGRRRAWLRPAGRQRRRDRRTFRPRPGAGAGADRHPRQGFRYRRRLRSGQRGTDRDPDSVRPALHLHHQPAASGGLRHPEEPGCCAAKAGGGNTWRR